MLFPADSAHTARLDEALRILGAGGCVPEDPQYLVMVNFISRFTHLKAMPYCCGSLGAATSL